MSSSPVVPLSSIPEGGSVCVVSLAGGNNFRERVTSMGVHVGADVQVLRKSGGKRGSSVIAIGETRIAIGHGMAEKVMVSPQ